ncbi:hypothetical protein V1478_007171 [Vespula squamosa]|uniref:Uncharacterized protein n=1 Tax=Vespula squamosa TaxID=30214 RepID=A0ABD2B2G7_VESSQ
MTHKATEFSVAHGIVDLSGTFNSTVDSLQELRSLFANSLNTKVVNVCSRDFVTLKKSNERDKIPLRKFVSPSLRETRTERRKRKRSTTLTDVASTLPLNFVNKPNGNSAFRRVDLRFNNWNFREKKRDERRDERRDDDTSRSSRAKCNREEQLENAHRTMQILLSIRIQRLTFGSRKKIRARADAWLKGLRASRCKARVPQIASSLILDKYVRSHTTKSIQRLKRDTKWQNDLARNWHDPIDVKQGLNT